VTGYWNVLQITDSHFRLFDNMVTMKRTLGTTTGRQSLARMRWEFLLAGLLGVTVFLLFCVVRDNTYDYAGHSTTGSLSIRDTNLYSQAKQCLVEPLKSPTAMQRATTVPLSPPQNSTNATVMAMATGYGLGDYQRFVGSLRKAGYLGHIILAVSPDVSPEIEQYLLSRDVDIHKVQRINCTVSLLSDEEVTDEHAKELITCLHPYPSLKQRWARFPMLRDYLMDCTTCTGPVLITDMRDTVFQRDPFGPDAPVVPFNTLQVFQEHYTVRTTHWLVDGPVRDCKGVQYNEPMLCSGTTIGTRSAMLEYLRIMHAEMEVWMNDPKCCCFKFSGDDQAMHNYLFYSGMLDHIAVAIPNRIGLVNTVGVHAALVFSQHESQKKKELEAAGKDPDAAHLEPYALSTDFSMEGEGNWLGLHYGLTDKEGYLVNYDGARSFVVHQIDRFASSYGRWLEKNKERFLDY
jgi:hypothetical protein